MAYQEVGFSGEQYVLEKGVYRNCDDWGSSNSALASLQPVLQVCARRRSGASQRGGAWRPPAGGRDWNNQAWSAWGRGFLEGAGPPGRGEANTDLEGEGPAKRVGNIETRGTEAGG